MESLRRGLIELNADCEEAEIDMQEEAGPSPDVELKLRTIKEKIKELHYRLYDRLYLRSYNNLPLSGPILIITDGYIEDDLKVRREHAYLIPNGNRLPFRAKGKVFYMENRDKEK